MTPEELDRLIADSERKIAVVEAFAESEEWRLLSDFLDGRLRRMDNEGKGLRRRLMRPVAGQPGVTLEQIAAHEARIDETAGLRRLPKLIVGIWREQLPQLLEIRDRAAR